MPTIGQRQKVLFTGFCHCGFEVRLSHTASRRDRQTAQHKQYVHHKNCRGGAAEQLKCVHCNKLFATVRARAAHELLVGFVGGVIGCFGLKPIVHDTSGSALNGLKPMTCLE